MLEVLLSCAMLASLLGFVANVLYASPSTQNAYDFRMGNALYDFGSMLYRNAAVMDCITTSNRQCELGIEGNLSSALSLKYVQLSFKGMVVASGSEERCTDSQERCYLMPANGTYGLLCMHICD